MTASVSVEGILISDGENKVSEALIKQPFFWYCCADWVL